MNEVGEYWYRNPEIGFEYHRILTINRGIIELADLTGEMFEDILHITQPRIDEQIEILNKMRRYRGGSERNPHILIGRLAVSESEDDALRPQAIAKEDIDITREDLLKRYQVFWDAINRLDNTYFPAVHRNMLLDYPSLNGTWLGLSH